MEHQKDSIVRVVDRGDYPYLETTAKVMDAMLKAGGPVNAAYVAMRLGRKAAAVAATFNSLIAKNRVWKVRYGIYALTGLGEGEAKARVELDGAKREADPDHVRTIPIPTAPDRRADSPEPEGPIRTEEMAPGADIQRWKEEAMYWREKFAAVCLELARRGKE